MLPVTGSVLTTVLDTNSFRTLAMVDADQVATFTWAPPTNWDKGTIGADIYYHIDTATSTVCLGIQGGALGDGELVATALGGIRAETDVPTADAVNIITIVTPMTIAGTIADDDLIIFEVERDADGVIDNCSTDVNTDSADLIGVKLTYTTDSSSAP